MRELLLAIWQGTGRRHPSATPAPASAPVPAAVPWFVLVAVLAGLRLLLPFTPTDTMLVHSRIMESLLVGQSWGRQALVSSLEFPPLPTLVLALVRWLFGWTGLPPAHLAVALGQAWAVTYLLRLPTSRRALAQVLLGGAALLLLAPVRDTVVALDPGWITAIPAAAALFHAVLWHRDRALRDGIVCAANAGLLVFGGLPGLALAAALVLALRHDLRGRPEARPGDRNGTILLIWAPFLYAGALVFVADWLIMADPLYSLRQLWDTLASVSPGTYARRTVAALAAVPLPVPAALLSLLVVALSRAGRPLAFCLTAVLLAAAAAHLLLAAFPLLGATAAVPLLAAALLGLLSPLLGPGPDLVPGSRRVWLVAPLLLAALSLYRPTPFTGVGTGYLGPAPAPERMAAWIDRFWPNSRVVVYGTQGPALYPDPAEDRFLGRVDFREDMFLKQARDEQLHLLVPPADGRYYPPGRGPLAEVHAQGRPWLLLEIAWPGGWQLWRCVVPPATESRLRNLRPRVHSPTGRE